MKNFHHDSVSHWDWVWYMNLVPPERNGNDFFQNYQHSYLLHISLPWRSFKHAVTNTLLLQIIIITFFECPYIDNTEKITEMKCVSYLLGTNTFSQNGNN
jgi:hypothetical protein